MYERQNISSGAKWEASVGYSRAVKVGPFIFVAGTTAVGDNGEIVGEGDVYAQTKRIFEIIDKALKAAGASLEHVVRTRMFITDIAQWEQAGKAHGEIFGNIRPAATMVEVQALIDPRLLIEIEVDAVLTND
ncbi:MAG: RidA family protein [Chloroflexi bacterium]|nr:RidA family protein [Chloroflexota bacterium]